MDDTVFLVIFMSATFVTIPSLLLLWRRVRFWLVTHNYMKKKGTRLGARARLEAYLFVETNYGLYLDVFQVVLSVFSCACFVAEMYVDDLNDRKWYQILELAVGTVFGMDYIFRFYLAKRKLEYFFSPLALIDFATVLPTFVFAALVVKGNSVTFLRVLRLMRALRVLRVLKILRLVMGKHTTAAQTDVTRMAVKVGFTCICLIFCAACFFALNEGMDFHIAFYYVLIEALSRPHCPIMTVPGYLLMYALVILTVTLLPPQLAQVVAAYASQRDEHRFILRVSQQHIVLCGDLTHFMLDEVLNALFADTSLGFKVCVMTPTVPNVYMKRTAENLNSTIP
eukprot:TRINITY_DN17570_c0_g1_i1.p1 TRINITY_DN17570_c0_g1~~TRINITY_DN17570_c0_g1_i1.p1  ORF type:complete len:339 (+),score=69.87 TRINITY_DN17570_c0_g1_i1:215-1231(+)